METTEKKTKKQKKETAPQKEEKIAETTKKQEIPETKVDEAKKEVKEEQKTTETKKQEIQKKKIEKIKKNEAVVNIQNAPVSTKFSMALCKFIKNKEIEKAINELEQVLSYKKAVPMKGGVGHKKSAGHFASGSGKYPLNAAKYFITLLKSLSANAVANGLENPIITKAFANMGQKPRARFGRWQRKRTHIILTAREKKLNKKINPEEKKN